MKLALVIAKSIRDVVDNRIIAVFAGPLAIALLAHCVPVGVVAGIDKDDNLPTFVAGQTSVAVNWSAVAITGIHFVGQLGSLESVPSEPGPKASPYPKAYDRQFPGTL